MRARDVTNFISIGEPYARRGRRRRARSRPERCLAIPRLLPEQYPAAMSLFDIVFDPMGRAPWRRFEFSRFELHLVDISVSDTLRFPI